MGGSAVSPNDIGLQFSEIVISCQGLITEDKKAGAEKLPN
jgi:hypothetical protein